MRTARALLAALAVVCVGKPPVVGADPYPRVMLVRAFQRWEEQRRKIREARGKTNAAS